MHLSKTSYKGILSLLLAFLLSTSLLVGCSSTEQDTTEAEQLPQTTTQEQTQQEEPQQEVIDASAYTLDNIPAYNGAPYVEINNNVPNFTDEDKARSSFEEYSPLDYLGRCGAAFALVGVETMPTEERGSIGEVKPSGWHTVRYNGVVDGNYLYNRCHLLGYQLTGENANE